MALSTDIHASIAPTSSQSPIEPGRDFPDHPPQPDTTGIRMRPCRMKQVFLEAARVQRDLRSRNPEYCGVSQHQSLWKHCHQVRIGHDVNRMQICGDSQRNISAETFVT
jgi:hypothetical protein